MEEMTISKLIAELTEMMENYGDLAVNITTEGDYKDQKNWCQDVTQSAEVCGMHYECVIHA